MRKCDNSVSLTNDLYDRNMDVRYLQEPELYAKLKKSEIARGSVTYASGEPSALENAKMAQDYFRHFSHQMQMQKKQLNDLQREMGKLRKAKADPSEYEHLTADIAKSKKEIELLEEKVKNFEKKRDEFFSSVGNLVHESVPVSRDEDDNQIIRDWGTRKTIEEAPLHHSEVMRKFAWYLKSVCFIFLLY